MVYLDNNSTTKVDPLVFEAMEPFLRGDNFGNPSSIHTAGRIVRDAIEESRSKVSSLLNCSPSEIIFSSGGTESINSAISSFVNTHGGNKVLISSVEHAAVDDFTTAKFDETAVVKVGVDENGQIDLDLLQNSLDENISLVSIIYAHNETGILSPVSEIVEICTPKGVLCHFDAVQAVGKIPINLSNLECDLISLSAHKFHGPKGAGALYIKDGLNWTPFQIGGGQERGRRAGTESVANILGLGKASELAALSLSENSKLLLSLRNRFEAKVTQEFESAVIVGSNVERLPNTSNICFDGYEAEALIPLLDQKGVCVSHGAACSSGSWGPPKALKEMAYADDLAKGSIRFSFSKFNSEKDIDLTIQALHESFTLLDSINN